MVCNAAEDRVQLLLGRRGSIVCLREAQGSGRTVQALPQAMAACFQEAGIKASQLDGLAYVRGPGTFTGLRVSIALAVGLARGGNILLAGLEYLPLIAASLPPDPAEVWVCTYARKGLVYVQGFAARRTPLSGLVVASLENAADMLERRTEPLSLVGSGVSAWKDFWQQRLPGARILEECWNHPHPTQLLQAARQAAYAHDPPPPLYLRPADAEVNIPQLAAGRGISQEDFTKRIPDFLRMSS